MAQNKSSLSRRCGVHGVTARVKNRGEWWQKIVFVDEERGNSVRLQSPSSGASKTFDIGVTIWTRTPHPANTQTPQPRHTNLPTNCVSLRRVVIHTSDDGATLCRQEARAGEEEDLSGRLGRYKRRFDEESQFEEGELEGLMEAAKGSSSSLEKMKDGKPKHK
ncbi:hypothetical protein FRC10_002568 [Ceratobasidium sp. 414]|nr:hypothetical protein FRC10_002568 [Ceratobasidium sp. 414]